MTSLRESIQQLNCFGKVKTNAVYSMGILMCSCEAETSSGEGRGGTLQVLPSLQLLLCCTHHHAVCLRHVISLILFNLFQKHTTWLRIDEVSLWGVLGCWLHPLVVILVGPSLLNILSHSSLFHSHLPPPSPPLPVPPTLSTALSASLQSCCYCAAPAHHSTAMEIK